jgi:hypothetical protein
MNIHVLFSIVMHRLDTHYFRQIRMFPGRVYLRNGVSGVVG